MKKLGIGVGIIALALGIVFTLINTGTICFHKYSSPTCTQNAICIKCGKLGDPALGHSIHVATCTEPAYCDRCGITQGAALGHEIVPATCTNGSFCGRCGASLSAPLGHDFSLETETTPAICNRCNSMKPLPRPMNGIINQNDSGRGSSLRIDNTRGDSDCYIKLKDSSNREVLSFYVRRGTSYTATVPSKRMYVYFSYGTNWYGPRYAFGAEGHYAKDDEISDFYNYEIEYTLYSVAYGNFSETPISYNSF